MVELFNVTTTIKQFHGCKDVRMEWLVIDRKMPVAVYAEVIRDYPTGADKEYAEACADELFTGEEARALMAYLDSLRKWRHPKTFTWLKAVAPHTGHERDGERPTFSPASGGDDE